MHQGLAYSYPEGTSGQQGHFAGQPVDEMQVCHHLRHPLVEIYHHSLKAHSLEQHHSDDNIWPILEHSPLYCQAKLQASSVE